jgi:hypothetical protein
MVCQYVTVAGSAGASVVSGAAVVVVPRAAVVVAPELSVVVVLSLVLLHAAVTSKRTVASATILVVVDSFFICSSP